MSLYTRLGLFLLLTAALINEQSSKARALPIPIDRSVPDSSSVNRTVHSELAKHDVITLVNNKVYGLLQSILDTTENNVNDTCHKLADRLPENLKHEKCVNYLLGSIYSGKRRLNDVNGGALDTLHSMRTLPSKATVLDLLTLTQLQEQHPSLPNLDELLNAQSKLAELRSVDPMTLLNSQGLNNYLSLALEATNDVKSAQKELMNRIVELKSLNPSQVTDLLNTNTLLTPPALVLPGQPDLPSLDAHSSKVSDLVSLPTAPNGLPVSPSQLADQLSQLMTLGEHLDENKDLLDQLNLPANPLGNLAVPANPLGNLAVPANPLGNLAVPANPLGNLAVPANPLGNLALPANPLGNLAVPANPLGNLAVPANPLGNLAVPANPLGNPLNSRDLLTQAIYSNLLNIQNLIPKNPQEELSRKLPTV